MANISTGSTAIKFGSNLRIGYRINNSGNPFTYLSTYPDYSQLPYTFTLTSGEWEVEYTELCPSCEGKTYSDSKYVIVSVP